MTTDADLEALALRKYGDSGLYASSREAFVEGARAAIAARQGGMDIATAPKDERILLFVPAFGPWNASWWPGSWAWAREQWAIHTPFSGTGDRAIFGTDGPTPTHWQPLPLPPLTVSPAAPTKEPK